MRRERQRLFDEYQAEQEEREREQLINDVQKLIDAPLPTAATVEQTEVPAKEERRRERRVVVHSST